MKPRMRYKSYLWFAFSKVGSEIFCGSASCPFVAYMRWAELANKVGEQ